MLSQRTFVNVSTGNVRGGGTRLSTIGTSAVFGVPFSAIVVLCVEKSVQMNSWNASIRGLEIEIDRFTTRIEVVAESAHFFFLSFFIDYYFSFAISTE